MKVDHCIEWLSHQAKDAVDVFVGRKEALRKKKIKVFGNTILDEYVCLGEYPQVRKCYLGGAWYVAQLLSRFCSVILITDVLPVNESAQDNDFITFSAFKGEPQIKRRLLNELEVIVDRQDIPPAYLDEAIGLDYHSAIECDADGLAFIDYGGCVQENKVVAALARSSGLVIYNTQLNRSRPELPSRELLNESSIWTMNQREADAYRQLLGVKKLSLRALRSRHKSGLLVETLGSKGIFAQSKNDEVSMSVPGIIESSCAIGMGDTFLAYLMLCSLLGMEIRQSLLVAVLAGTAKAKIFGHERIIDESDFKFAT
jgi:hypothetical protein